jgi:hypothetical protein
VKKFALLGHDNLEQFSGITDQLLVSHRAKWHDKCRQKYTADKLVRATQKKQFAPPQVARARRTSFLSMECIFCEKKTSEKLRSMETLEMDGRLKLMSRDLKDDKLMARLSEGDVIALEAKYHLTCYMYILLSKTRESYEGNE